MLFEEVLEEYLYHCLAKGFTKKTMINKRQEYKQLNLFLKEKRGLTELESITVHDLRAYMRYKQQQDGLQPQSIVTMFKMIKAFFNWCYKEEYLRENISRRVELPRVPKKVLNGFTEKEVQTMIDAFSYKDYIEARNKAMIAIMADCGLRAMEIRGLKSKNVKDTSLLVDGKGNKQRMVFVSPTLKRILIKYERLKSQYFKEHIAYDDRYFLSYQGREISHTGLHKVVKVAGERAGVQNKRVSPHTFRHFYAVQALTNGVDVYSLSQIMGHSDITVTQRYLQSMSKEQLFDKAIASSPLMNMGRNR
ncbi:tyrosine-type recombinase/integrase [Fictibacillus enclensis]|uniref:tyrosine-type recombinase/integrase n=1 Tax=Fictibacillus enclensis TaxID=1017270 RepID=UPI0024BF2816|nr:tyrosine-type recombinase/integrase [Fictibacillus enclensis]WHY74586.1 tyrosine-type recombinase/integrase [Fictibacillus enclensis]